MINYDWNDIVFKDKGDLKKKEYIFIAASREISDKRFIEILKTYLPLGNLLIGISKEEYIKGFENQPQFRTFTKDNIFKILDKFNGKPILKNIDTIEYFQNDLKYILSKVKPKKSIFINGSWFKMFHLREEFYTLVKENLKYEIISAFINQDEALKYLENITRELDSKFYSKSKRYSDNEIFKILDIEASLSFATDFQTSACLVKNNKILILKHNEVIPFETYAMLEGSIKEKNFSTSNDLNYFDTNHAEMGILLSAIENSINIKDTSLYINLLPCPNCTRVLLKSKIKEVVYKLDHSDSYAIKMFEKVGIQVRRYIG